MNTQYKVTRKAILIGCPGEGKDFLLGVKQDLKNVSAFLKSEKGGAWFDREIEILNSPNWPYLYLSLSGATPDYLFIYFSGHGYTSEEGNRMVCIKGHDIVDVSLLNACPKQLVIVDACRTFIKSGLSGLPDFGGKVDHFTGVSAARELFDQFINDSPVGKMIVHATQPGNFSYDSPKGGYFTQALLNISTRLLVTEPYTYEFVGNLIPDVNSFLTENGSDQRPGIVYSSGNLAIPFAIGIPGNALVPREAAKEELKFTNNELWGMGIAASILLIIGIAAVTRNK